MSKTWNTVGSNRQSPNPFGRWTLRPRNEMLTKQGEQKIKGKKRKYLHIKVQEYGAWKEIKIKKIVFCIFPIHYVFTKTLLHKNILLVDDLNLKGIKALFRARSLCSKISGNVSSSPFPVKPLWTYCDLRGRFIMFSVITNIYNKKTNGYTLMELFTATGKLKKIYFITRDFRCVHHG
jgi:hypothetical protein